MINIWSMNTADGQMDGQTGCYYTLYNFSKMVDSDTLGRGTKPGKHCQASMTVTHDQTVH